MIDKQVKLNEKKVDEVFNKETLELEVQVLSVMLKHFKCNYCMEHQLDYNTPIDLIDDNFYDFFITEYLKIGYSYKSVYLMINLVRPDLKIEDLYRSFLINKRLETMTIKPNEYPDLKDQEVKNGILFNKWEFANLLSDAKDEFCNCHSLQVGDIVDVTDTNFLVYLFEEYAKDVNVVGGHLLYDKIDEYLKFMNR